MAQRVITMYELEIEELIAYLEEAEARGALDDTATGRVLDKMRKRLASIRKMAERN